MTFGAGDDGWSRPTHVNRPADLDAAYARRRAAASFGGGSGPGFAEAARGFVHRYGWRAYALPMLLVITLVALLTTRTSPSQAAAEQPPGSTDGGAAAAAPTSGSAPAPTPSATQTSSPPPVAPASIPLKSDDGTTSGKVNDHMITKAELPAGRPYTLRGDGTFRVLEGHSGVAGRTGRLFRYDIEVENGITGVDLRRYAALVQATLADPRSWSGHGVRVQRVDSGPIDFHVSLTSVLTVRKYCGYTIRVETSCYAPAGSAPGVTVNRVVFDVARWVRGAAPYANDLSAYRIYMINHEDGHAMGHEHAHQCLPGGLAPVMMQQTFGLRSAATGTLCGANPWPFPPGVSGAPGAEQPDTAANNEYYLGD